MKMAPGWDDKLKGKAKRARSYRARATLPGAPQQEGVINIFFTINVVCFSTVKFDMGTTKKVNFDALVAFQFSQGKFYSSTDCLTRTVHLYTEY